MRNASLRPLLGPVLLACALGAALLVGSGVFASASPTAGARATSIERDVKCPEPGCGDLSILQSEAPASIALRVRIAREVALGASTSAILQGIEDRYGSDVLLTPPSSGLDDVLWVTPVALACLACLAGLAALRRRARRATAPPAP